MRASDSCGRKTAKLKQNRQTKKSRPKPGESGGLLGAKNASAPENQCNLDQLTSFTASWFKSKLRARMASMSRESELCVIGWLSSTTPLNSLPSRYSASVKMNWA
jgi:hypothetical protein